METLRPPSVPVGRTAVATVFVAAFWSAVVHIGQKAHTVVSEPVLGEPRSVAVA